MESSNNAATGTEFARPRRPNPDTIAYLKSLPLDEEAAQGEILNFYNHEKDSNCSGSTETPSSDFPSSLAAALTALDEIRQEVASLAGDERGSEVLEVLIKITAPHSLSASHKWLTSCLGHAHHLALHRYGSHVLQTVLEQSFLSTSILTTSSGNQEDLALHLDSPVNMEEWQTTTKDDLWDLLGQLQQELLPVALQLKTHLCATHVLRTLFLIMGGIVCSNLQSPRRGKVKSKTNGKAFSALASSGSGLLGSRIHYLETYHRRPSDNTITTAALDEWADALASPSAGVPPTELHELVCHASGGPLLVVLLRSITYRDNPNKKNRSSTDAADAVARSLGTLPSEPKFDDNSKACFLAKSILCLEENQSVQSEDAVYGLAGDARGSHVLDIILRLCHDEMHERIIEVGKFRDSLQEYVEHDVSNFVVQTLLATVRNAKVAEILVKACVPLIESGLILDAHKRRRGILWRLTEMAVQYRVGEAMILQTLQLACPGNKIAAMLLDPKRNSANDNRLTLNVEGTRALYYLLHFSGAEGILEGLVAMSVDDLDALARDGLGSRCVWDVLFEPHSGTGYGAAFTKARTKLLTKLKGRWISLATDRVGHHAVLKLFRSLPTMKARGELMRELSEGRHRLQGNAMGRSILSECEVDSYKNQGFADWSKKIQSQIEQRAWLDDLSSNAIQNGSECGNDDVQKRKRAHHGTDYKRTAHSSSEQAPAKKRLTSTSMTVDSIFDALTVPMNSKKQEMKRGGKPV